MVPMVVEEDGCSEDLVAEDLDAEERISIDALLNSLNLEME